MKFSEDRLNLDYFVGFEERSKLEAFRIFGHFRLNFVNLNSETLY